MPQRDPLDTLRNVRDLGDEVTARQLADHEARDVDDVLADLGHLIRDRLVDVWTDPADGSTYYSLSRDADPVLAAADAERVAPPQEGLL